MTDLELAYEAENEISFELSHLRWHIPKSKVFMENLKNESYKAVANSKITAPLCIATLDIKEKLILEDGPSGLIKSDLTDHPPTPMQMDCLGTTQGRILSKFHT